MIDKYAVVTDEDAEKIASKTGQPCPICGSRKVDFTGTTPHCPNCGTKPWEPNVGPEHRRHGR